MPALGLLDLRLIVRDSLRNAIDNGNAELKTMDPTKVVEDLLTCDADLEGASPDAVVAMGIIVKEWQTEKVQYVCDEARHLICVPYSAHFMHEMAAELGVKRGWFHPGDKAHYDIPKSRVADVTKLCHVVSSKLIVKITSGAAL